MKLLLIDDIKSDRKLFTKILNVNGYEVIEASNGVEALRLLENLKPDVIFSKIGMLGMDGFTLLMRLKKNIKTSIIPFVLYTETYLSDEDIELGSSLGASKSFQRPPDPGDLILKIEEVLKEFKAGKLKPIRPKITEEEYLDKYSRRISQTLESELFRIDREIEKRKNAEKALQDEMKERQKGEEQLRRASLYARSLIEASLDPLVTINRDGKITDVNKATEDVTGVKRGRLIGTDFSDYFTEPESARSGYRQVFEKEFVKNYPLTIRHISGRTTDVLYNATIYRNEAGEVEGVFAAARDITDRKRAEEAMKDAKEEAERANHIKSVFLGKMSHELRTPLNAIMGFNELLAMKTMGELNENQEHYVNNIANSSKHLLGIINDILDLVKVESGSNLPLSIESFHPQKAIEETLVFVTGKALQKNLSIKKEIDAELDIILADKIRFKQILINLLDNAIKFSKPQGGTILIEAKKTGDMAQFSISDEGIGIRDEEKGKLFSLFYQADSGINRKYGGTGVGLAIIKQLVEQQNGRLWVESRYGEGTTFFFTLPIIKRKYYQKDDN